MFIVDDDSSVLRALGRLLTANGFAVRTFQSATAFLAAHDASVPGCAVLDVSMPELSGLDVQNRLGAGGGSPRPIIFVTGQGDVPTSVRAMKAGAIDFLTKPVDERALVEAVRSAIGIDNLHRARTSALTDLWARHASLTTRERQVLAGVAAGQLNKQIAADLNIAEKTVKVHRARAMAKMQTRSVADLARLMDLLGNPGA